MLIIVDNHFTACKVKNKIRKLQTFMLFFSYKYLAV